MKEIIKKIILPFTYDLSNIGRSKKEIEQEQEEIERVQDECIDIVKKQVG